jgi:hypothetical protein
MFVQVINGRTQDPAGLRRRFEVWREEVRPGAIGFLGSTVGITDDGVVVAVVRFADEASARANADRVERKSWWSETSKLFDGEPTWRESSDVKTLFDGGSDDARFVQVMEGVVKDRAAAEAMETPEMLQELRTARPDLIGSLRIWFQGGAFVEIAYFTNEAEARKGESSDQFAGPEQAFEKLFGEMSFVDVRDPILLSP